MILIRIFLNNHKRSKDGTDSSNSTTWTLTRRTCLHQREKMAHKSTVTLTLSKNKHRKRGMFWK